VLSRGRLLGYLALGRRVGGEKYGALDSEVLQASVSLLGASIENNVLVNRVMESNRILRQTNEKHEELDRLKSEFLRNLNHELKTPLTVMIAFLDSLLSQEPADGSRRAHLVQVREQTARLQGMLLNLLDFSKLLRHEFDLRIERTDVHAMLQRFFRERRPGIASGLRELKLSAASQVPPALCDPERLIRILDALVDNAAKFTPEGSQIHLRLDSAQDRGHDWVRIQVSDNGPGMPQEYLSSIFDSFRQGDGSATRSHGGIGIGLAFAKKLIEEMNGSLGVESTIGQGATFTVMLPV
jgi:signal transduction histidine kinase